MAITSEEVVENGAQVVEQVNKLAEQMIVFQQRLDGISEVFDEVQEVMDDGETEVKEALDSALEIVKGEALTDVKSVGESLEQEVKTASIEALDQVKTTLETEFSKVNESSGEVVSRWEEWRDSDMQELMNAFEQQAQQTTEHFSNLNQAVSADIDLMGEVADTYVSKSVEMTGQMTEFVDEAISSLNVEREKYQSIMLEEFTSELGEALAEGHAILKDVQNVSTEQVFQELGDQFDDHVKSQLVPLIDNLVEHVSEAVDEMLADIAKIGNDADDKSQALDAVTGVLEQLISPIRDIIDRTQSIKNVVDAFI